MGGWIDVWYGEWMVDLMDGWIWVCDFMDGWVVWWVDGQFDGWMTEGWTDEWLDILM